MSPFLSLAGLPVLATLSADYPNTNVVFGFFSGRDSAYLYSVQSVRGLPVVCAWSVRGVCVVRVAPDGCMMDA